MAVKELLITPAIATELLNRNTNNRILRKRIVEKLALAMKRDEWQYNGDVIRISKSGRLLDGQHRLSAIELSGIPQKYIVVDELDDDVFTTIDTGQARSAGGMLSMAGETCTSTLAAVAKMHFLFLSTGKPSHGNPDKHPTHSQIVDLALNNSGLQLSSTFAAGNKWLAKYVRSSITAFCHYEFGQIDKIARDAFFNELATGEFSYHNSPLKHLREIFIEEKGLTSSPDKLRRCALLFKAFNLYRDKTPAKILRLPLDQDGWFILNKRRS